MWWGVNLIASMDRPEEVASKEGECVNENGTLGGSRSCRR